MGKAHIMDKNIYGMLSDNDIRRYFGKEIKIYTEYRTGELKFDLDKQLQLASIDLRFRNEYSKFKKDLNTNLSLELLANHAYTEPFSITNSERLVINPGEVVFTTTLEIINISNEFAGIITGRSSVARLGIMVHCCQEFINPGQGAPIALQIINLGKYPVELDMRIPICQLILFKLNSPASDLYSQKPSSKYKNETQFISSKLYQEDTFDTKATNNKPKRNHKAFLKKYISPFLPSIIMLLLIKPILELSQNITISNFFSSIFSVPLSIIAIIICVALFIYIRKKED